MAKLTRKDALRAIYGAGATGDQAAFARLYVENRISYGVAIAEFRRGAAFAEFVRRRDRMGGVVEESRQ